MHLISFGEGEGLTDKAGHSLGGVACAIAAEQLPEAQGAVPALHVAGLACVFAHRTVSGFGEDFCISIPEIAEGVTWFVVFRDQLPESATGLSTVVTADVGHDLKGSSA